MEKVKALSKKVVQAILNEKVKRAALRGLRAAAAIIIPVIVGELLKIDGLLWAAPLLLAVDKYVRDSK